MASLRTMSEGAAISIKNGNLIVPEEPLVHYIEGDGIGIDITPVMINVVDAAVEKAYSEERKIHWNEVLAGQKAFDKTGEWLPEETLESISFQYILDSGFDIENLEKDDIENITVGIQLGAGVELGSIGIDVRWERGFNDLETNFLDENSNTNIEFDTRVSQIIVGLSYTF